MGANPKENSGEKRERQIRRPPRPKQRPRPTGPNDARRVHGSPRVLQLRRRAWLEQRNRGQNQKIDPFSEEELLLEHSDPEEQSAPGGQQPVRRALPSALSA